MQFPLSLSSDRHHQRHAWKSLAIAVVVALASASPCRAERTVSEPAHAATPRNSLAQSPVETLDKIYLRPLGYCPGCYSYQDCCGASWCMPSGVCCQELARAKRSSGVLLAHVVAARRTGAIMSKYGLCIDGPVRRHASVSACCGMRVAALKKSRICVLAVLLAFSLLARRVPVQFPRMRALPVQSMQ